MGKRLLGLAIILALAGGLTAHGADWPPADAHIVGLDCEFYCDKSDDAQCMDYCEMNKADFPKQYSDAISGGYQGQRNVAYCLSTGCDGSIIIDKTLGCAWRIVIMSSGHPDADSSDESNLETFCGESFLSDSDRQTAVHLAKEMLGRLSN